MFVIEKMRLNKYKPTPIVPNRAIALSQGESDPVVTSKQTYKCATEPDITGASKTKVMGLAMEISEAAYKNHKGDKQPELNKSQRDL